MPDTVGIAACADDPDLMFPMRESTRPGAPTGEERRALRVCGSCPLLATCRTAMLSDRIPMPYGVAGGMTAADRRAVRAAQQPAVTPASRPEEAHPEVAAPRGAETTKRPTGRPAASRPAASARVVRSAPPPSTSAPSVTPTALAALNRSADTTTAPSPAAPTTAAPAPRPSAPTSPTSPSASTAAARGDELDEVIARLLRTYPTSLADPATVRDLVHERGPATASRWEVAIAAMAMLTRGTAVAAAARALGEDGTQLRRWRDRRDTGRPLVLGGNSTGTHRLARPARLVAASQRGAA